MASAAVMSPGKDYAPYPLGNRPPPSPYSQHLSAQPSPYSISGLISPPISNGTESRRTSDDPTEYAQHQRQSLPSISEALFSRTGAQGASQPPAATPTLSQPFANPNPFGQAPPTPTSRSYSSEGPPYTTQQPVHSHYPPKSSPPPLQPPSSFSGSSHFSAPNPDIQRHQSLPSLRTAIPSQTSPFPAHQQEQNRYEPASRPGEQPANHVARRHNDNYYGYANNPSNGYTPVYPARPRSPPYYHGQGPHSRDEPPRGVKRDLDNGEPEPPMMFQKTLQHNLGNHDFEMALCELQQCGNEVSKISEDILDTVRRYQRDTDVQGIPVMRYHDAMLGCQRKLEEAFHNVKHFMAQQQRQLDDHRLRNQSGKGPEYGREDEQWSVDKDQAFHGPDAKKIRRGRAAPPGRCHSCNRAETPEWRRGPDGARTLCNACGLHYAKLTRRMGSKQAQSTVGSSLRPKSLDGTSPL